MIVSIINFWFRVKSKFDLEFQNINSKAVAKRFKQCGKGFNIYLPFNIVGYGGIKIGNNVHINRHAYIQGAGGLIIGDNVHIGPRLLLYTTSHNYNGDAIPYDHTIIRKSVIIEDNVWIGAGVTIIPGITIGEGAIIAAGSVISKNIEPYEIVGGMPHRILKKRNVEHYKKMKHQNKFGGRGGKLYEITK